MEIFFFNLKLLFSLLLFFMYHFHDIKDNLQALLFLTNDKLKLKYSAELWH